MRPGHEETIGESACRTLMYIEDLMLRPRQIGSARSGQVHQRNVIHRTATFSVHRPTGASCEQQGES
jgi:hypothetical protein